MDLSDSSSDDECNVYVNAASKLYELNRRDAHSIKHKNADDSNDMIVQESKNISSVENGNAIEKEAVSQEVNSDCTLVNSKNKLQNGDKHALINLVPNDDVIAWIEDDDDECNIDSIYNMGSNRTTRNSNKIKSPISSSLKAPIVINDSIEHELNETYNDSLDLSQDENDSYVLIGSPPPAKKSKTDDDYEVSVKVLWKSNKVERFELKRSETFQKVFRHFANVEGVHEDQILITKKDKRLTPFDTPLSINWSIIDILDGGVVSAEIVKQNKTNSSQNKVQENTCQIKVQTSDKRTLTVSLKNDDPFTNLLKKCSNELNIPEAKIKLYFDGELIDENETPESLDFDEEACVDLKIIK